VAIIVVFGGIMVFNQIQKSAGAKAGEAFGTAMIAYNAHEYDKAIELFRNAADNYRSTVQGIQSAYMLGTILYEKEKYDEAITWHTVASKGGEKADFIAGQAIEAIALCYEAKGDVKSAISYLETALKDNSVKFRHSAIKWKLALLNKNSDINRAKLLCNELVSDTLAKDFHQKAENLIAALEAGSAG
jgi:tetratricopeptide (TPR) repeat protein